MTSNNVYIPHTYFHSKLVLCFLQGFLWYFNKSCFFSLFLFSIAILSAKENSHALLKDDNPTPLEMGNPEKFMTCSQLQFSLRYLQKTLLWSSCFPGMECPVAQSYE